MNKSVKEKDIEQICKKGTLLALKITSVSLVAFISFTALMIRLCYNIIKNLPH